MQLKVFHLISGHSDKLLVHEIPQPHEPLQAWIGAIYMCSTEQRIKAKKIDGWPDIKLQIDRDFYYWKQHLDRWAPADQPINRD
jgi:hypothetical protein